MKKIVFVLAFVLLCVVTDDVITHLKLHRANHEINSLYEDMP
jgi:hypothetical protein